MAAAFGFAVLLIAVTVLPLICCGFPAILTLERAFPMSHQGDLSQLVHRDRARHSGMMLQSSSSRGVINFRLHGTYGLGIYSTRIQLGSPSRDFYVQIDTGSDVLWISCNCKDCPSTGAVHSPRSYDPRSSSTAHVVGCTDRRCPTAGCSAPHNLCNYTLQYADETSTSGYYISDLLHFETILANSKTVNATAPVVFGCSTQVVDTTTSFLFVDGILGLGQEGISVISQLTSQRLAPRAFSHCLRGDGGVGGGGGGFLVLGATVEPNMVYTPLVPFQSYYNVNLRSISVNGQRLSIDPSVFATSSNRGTIIDSGTTFAYLVDEAYYPFVHAVTASVSQVAHPFLSADGQCYSTPSNVSDHIFPEVRLDFEGGASLLFGPRDYLHHRSLRGGAVEWCLDFLRNEGYDFTILGDLVMQNKMFLYDLAAQRIGWVDHNCSMPVNVSTVDMASIGQGNAGGHRRPSISLRAAPDGILLLWIMVLLPLGLWECGGLWSSSREECGGKACSYAVLYR